MESWFKTCFFGDDVRDTQSFWVPKPLPRKHILQWFWQGLSNYSTSELLLEPEQAVLAVVGHSGFFNELAGKKMSNCATWIIQIGFKYWDLYQLPRKNSCKLIVTSPIINKMTSRIAIGFPMNKAAQQINMAFHQQECNIDGCQGFTCFFCLKSLLMVCNSLKQVFSSFFVHS